MLYLCSVKIAIFNNNVMNYYIIRKKVSFLQLLRPTIKTLMAQIKDYNGNVLVDRPDLGDFRGFNFSGMELFGAEFCDMDLTGADFSESNVKSCDFTGTILIGCNFSNANCEDSDFEFADLDKCNFSNANCKGADFEHSNINYSTDFLGADLDGSTLDEGDGFVPVCC